VFISALS